MASENAPSTPSTSFVNEIRLTALEWLAVIIGVTLTFTLTPKVWTRLEPLATGADYRIPYVLSKDYWLYERRLRGISPTDIVLLGDSVVWGEYVQADGTLSHFLNGQTQSRRSFVNAGVNGLFPLALEGLASGYMSPLKNRRLVVHCNLLWMSSPKADLSAEKEDQFNHADLVPQFSPRIPCYRADLSHRLAVGVERIVPFLQWSKHLQTAYFGQKNIPQWTLEDDNQDPPHAINAYRNPLAAITLQIPKEPFPDPERGQSSPRHKPWSTNGIGSARFEWVNSDQSLQWRAFQRLVQLLRSRENDVFVVVGPFNEHLLADDNRASYRHWRETVMEWLKSHQIPHSIPEALPSLLYADASHPLTEGYRVLAERLIQDRTFENWLEK